MKTFILYILACTCLYAQVVGNNPQASASDPTSQSCHVTSSTVLKQFGGVVYSCQGAMGTTGAYAVLPGGSGGTITAVNPGTGLAGGGSSGSVDLSLAAQANNTFLANVSGMSASPVPVSPAAAAAILPLGGTGTYVNGFGNPNSLQTTSPLTGSVARTGNSKLSDTPSVLDVSSVQTALSLSVGAGKLGFQVPDGAYTLTSMLTAYCSACPSLSLHGNSPNSTSLSYTGSGTVNAVLEVASDASPQTAGFYSATIRDLTAMGNGHNTFAWHFVNPSTSLFENLNAGGAQTTSGGYGFGFVGGSGITLKNLSCSPFVLPGANGSAAWPGGIAPWGCLDFEPGSTGPDIITVIGGNCSYIGPGPCFHVGGGGAGINSTGFHATQFGSTPTTLLKLDAGAQQISLRDCIFEVSTGGGGATDIAVIASDTTKIYNCDFTAGHVHFTGGHSGLFGDGSNVGNDGQLVIDSAVQSLLVSGAQFNTASAIVDNSTSTIYKNNWDAQNGHPLMNWPDQEMYETRTCPTCNASGGNLGDSVYDWSGNWAAASGVPLAISPVVFTKSKAWAAKFHGSWLNSGVPISNAVLNDVTLGDSDNVVTVYSGGTLTFTVDATTGKFTMASSASNLGFAGDIIFTPLSSTAAGSGYIGNDIGSYSIVELPNGQLWFYSSNNIGGGNPFIELDKSNGNVIIPSLTASRCVQTGSGSILGTSSGTCATVPNTANLLIGGASNTAADSGILPANVALINSSNVFSAAQTIRSDNPGISLSQLVIEGLTNTNQQLVFGYNTSSNYGYIQSVLQGTGFEPLELNPSGGQINLGANALVSAAGQVTATNLVDSVLTSGNCVQASTGGLLTTTGTACGIGSSYAGTGTATFAPQAGAGTGATAVCATSHVCDSFSGEVTLTSGSVGTPATGSQLIITLPITRANLPNCSVDVYGGSTFLGASKTVTTSTITISSGVALTFATAYTVDYVCGGN